MDKIDSMPEHMGSVNREMGILRKNLEEILDTKNYNRRMIQATSSTCWKISTKKSIASITLTGKKKLTRNFPTKSRNKSVTFSLTYSYFNITLEVLANAVWQEKKRYIDWEGRNKTLSAEDMIIYVENLKESTKTSGTNKQL